MPFPRYIQLQLKLPRYKRSKDLTALLVTIEDLRKALSGWQPALFDELRLLDTFVQGVLTRHFDNSFPSLRLSPHLSAESKSRAEQVYQLISERNSKGVCAVPRANDAPVQLMETPVSDVGSLDESSDAIFFNSDQKVHLMECQLQATELSQFVDVAYPHELYTSFQHAEQIRKRLGIYQHMSTEDCFLAAQLILVNILSREEIGLKALSSDAYRFFCQHSQLTPIDGCPAGLWDWAMSHRRSDNRRHTILLCSLLSPQALRPPLAWVLDARAAINAKHAAQWTSPTRAD